MRFLRTILVVGFVVAFAQASAQEPNASSEMSIRALVEEMVSVCENHVAESKSRFDAGMIDSGVLDAARIKLLEARIRLVELDKASPQDESTETKLGRPETDDAIRTLLEEMIAVREADLKLAEQRYEVGIIGPYEVELAKVRLSEARVRLYEHSRDGGRVLRELNTLLESWARVATHSERMIQLGVERLGADADARIALLNTRIRLIEARRKYE